MKARDTISAGDDASKIFDRRVELWKVVVDAGLADGIVLGGHPDLVLQESLELLMLPLRRSSIGLVRWLFEFGCLRNS